MRYLFILILLGTSWMALAQGKQRQTTLGKAVQASDVPEAVRKTFTEKFPGVTVTRWERRNVSNKKGTSVTRYIAVFTQEGLSARARFADNGTALSSSRYFNPGKAPEPVQVAAKRYEGFSLTGGEEIRTGKEGKLFYRVRFRKGAQKLVVFLDDTGAEVTRDKAPEELKEDEGESDGN